MTAFEWYSFFLCLVVFTLLCVLFGAMLVILIKQTVRLIRAGLEDEAIKKEYLTSKTKKHKLGCFESILAFVLGLLMLGFFAFSVFVNVTEDTYFNNMPTLRVVNSGSMSKKHEKNTYLTENNLNNHIETFDMILTYRIPAEEELKLYDIVVYEVDGIPVVHRIVGIEEPCASHPYDRYFLCQGDAVERPDRFPVYYSQMKGIYRDQRIPFIGSFVTFMQSPAGWLCILLVIGSLIGVPILEKKLDKEKRLRLLALGLLGEGPTTEAEDTAAPAAAEAAAPPTTEDTPSPFAHLAGRVNTRSFDEALALSGEEMQARYARLVALLSRFPGIRVIAARGARTYKCGHTPICRMAVRGRTLNAYLALSPETLADTKYIFEDVSGTRDLRLYPVRVRLSSERQTRWTEELLAMRAEQLGLTLLPEVQDIPEESLPTATAVEESLPAASPFAHLAGRVNTRSFDEALALSGEEMQARYARLVALLSRFPGIRMIAARGARTYKRGNTPVCRLAVRGRTLNAYLALPPHEFEGTKYIFEDLSGRRAYASYPMRLRLSSERQTRWTEELLTALAERLGLALLPEVHEIPEEAPTAAPASPFAHLEGREDNRSFAERLSHAPEAARARYARLSELLLRFSGIRVIEGRRRETYKRGNTPVARLAVRGRTLNAYLALPPHEFEGTKYIFEDLSGLRAHAAYPMRLRLSSERQTRWTEELLTLLSERLDIRLLDRTVALPQEPLTEDVTEEPTVAAPFSHLEGREDNRSFDERLAHASPEARERYGRLTTALLAIPGIRVIEAQRQKTYKRGNTPVARLAVKGKTLNIYLALSPSSLEGTKYIFEDLTGRRAHALYPVRIRLSSERQTRWAIELLARLARERGLTEDGE